MSAQPTGNPTKAARTAFLALISVRLMIPAAGDCQQPANSSATQKLPPNAKTHEATPQEMKKYDAETLVKAKRKAGPVLRNPNAGLTGIQPQALAVLEQQKRFVASSPSHASQTGMLSKASAQNPPDPGPSTLLSAGGSNRNKAAQPAPGLVRGSNTGMLHPQNGRMSYVCHGPVIIDVNGQTRNAIFTPQQQYDSYVIHGCSFGVQQGRAYLIGKFNAQQINLQTPYWTDTEIDARIDPSVTGELDQDTVSLVVAPAGAAEMKATGFKFLAARSDPAVLLTSVPASWVTLTTWVGASGESVPGHYFSPVAPGGSVPRAAAGTSLFVERDLGEKFTPGRDFFDKFQMAPGWILDSMQSFTYDSTPSCPGVVTYRQTFGPGQASWTSSQHQGIQMVGSNTSCSGFIPIAPPFVFWTYSNRSGSAYALNIWARGPRCTDPYSGNPLQQCMQNVRTCGKETC